MDVLEALRARRSIRAFKPDPVSPSLLREIVEAALWSPSWGDTQPWEAAIVGGEVLEEIRRGLAEKAEAGVEIYPELPNPIFPDPYNQRRRNNGLALFQHLSIGREDREKRRQWNLSGARLFGAPNALFLYLDRALGPWSILDLGIFLQSLLLAAQARGLGTCVLYASVQYPDVVRHALSLPDSKLLVIGVAMGYPNPEALPNKFRSQREPLEALAAWHGIAPA